MLKVRWAVTEGLETATGSPNLKASALSHSLSCFSILNSDYAILRLYSHSMKKSLSIHNYDLLNRQHSDLLNELNSFFTWHRNKLRFSWLSLPGPQSVFSRSRIVGIVLRFSQTHPSDTHALILPHV